MQPTEHVLESMLRARCGRARSAARALVAVGRAQQHRALHAIAERLRAAASEGWSLGGARGER